MQSVNLAVFVVCHKKQNKKNLKDICLVFSFYSLSVLWNPIYPIYHYILSSQGTSFKK